MNRSHCRHNNLCSGQSAALRGDVCLILPFLMILGACSLFNNDGPKYPTLEKEDLVGCWYVPQTEGSLRCEEACYSSTNLYYAIAVYDNTPIQFSFTEYSGTYVLYRGGSVGGSDLGLGYKKVHSGNPSKIDSSGFGVGMTIVRDTLYEIAAGHHNLLLRGIRSDSLRYCRPHWRIFSRPPDWDLP